MMFTGLPRDELEAIFHSQHWAWAYDPEQPPLFEWLVLGFGSLIDLALPGQALSAPPLWLSSAIKAILIGLTLAFLGAACRRMCTEDRDVRGARLAKPQPGRMIWAVGAPLAALAIPPLGFESVFNFTHSIALLATIAFCLHAVVRVTDRPTIGRYTLVGLALGLGTLTKYTFALFGLALLLACLLHAPVRRRLASPKLLVTLLVAGAVAAGHYLNRGAALAEVADHARAIADSGASLSLALRSLELLSDSFVDPVFAALPALIPILALHPSSLHPRGMLPRSLWAKAPLDETPAAKAEGWARFLSIILLAMPALALILTLAIGGDRLRHHYLIPVSVLLPLWALLRARAQSPSVRRSRITLVILAILAPLLPLAAGYTLTQREPQDCGRCLTLLPSAAAADLVRETGFEAGTILDGSLDWGANLLRFFPDSRLISTDPAFRHYTPPLPPALLSPSADQDRACLILLPSIEARAAAEGAQPDLGRVWREALERSGASIADPMSAGARFEAALLPLSDHPESHAVPLAFLLVPGGLGTCR